MTCLMHRIPNEESRLRKIARNIVNDIGVIDRLENTVNEDIKVIQPELFSGEEQIKSFDINVTKFQLMNYFIIMNNIMLLQIVDGLKKHIRKTIYQTNKVSSVEVTENYVNGHFLEHEPIKITIVTGYNDIYDIFDDLDISDIDYISDVDENENISQYIRNRPVKRRLSFSSCLSIENE